MGRLQLPRLFFNDLQSNGDLTSDPTAQGSALCFPFFIAEAKSGATGGNMFQAQNQAAVSGAMAINILRGLQKSYGDAGFSDDDLPLLVFSAVNEGPVHELWAHYWNANKGSHSMTCIGVWRTTNAKGARELVGVVASILRWGASDLKPSILKRVAVIARLHHV